MASHKGGVGQWLGVHLWSCLEEGDPSLHVLVVLQQPRRHQRHVQRVGALCPPASYNTRRHIECSVDLITPNS